MDPVNPIASANQSDLIYNKFLLRPSAACRYFSTAKQKPLRLSAEGFDATERGVQSLD
jgi:hypothetical protein